MLCALLSVCNTRGCSSLCQSDFCGPLSLCLSCSPGVFCGYHLHLCTTMLSYLEPLPCRTSVKYSLWQWLLFISYILTASTKWLWGNMTLCLIQQTAMSSETHRISNFKGKFMGISWGGEKNCFDKLNHSLCLHVFMFVVHFFAPRWCTFSLLHSVSSIVK